MQRASAAVVLAMAVEDASEEAAKVEITGTLAKDGTMTGTVSLGKHKAPWSGERLGR